MRQVTPRDPAPSRLAYRLNRLWLTPSFWRTLRFGLPLGLAVTGAGIWLGDAERRAALVEGVSELGQRIEERPEFSIHTVSVVGAEGALTEEVRAAAGLDLPLSSFDLDLPALRQRVAALDAVKAVRVSVQPGGTLTVRVEERVPAVLHRTADGLILRDDEGHRTGELTSARAEHDLPLIAGVGGERAVAEALEIYAAADPIADQMRGLVRGGERRWDAVLTRERRILLPEDAPVPALEQVIALDEAQDLLARHVGVIDMRNPARPTLRLGEHALDELRRIRAETTGSSNR